MLFSVVNGFVEEASLGDIARAVGTPTYCYSREKIENNFKAYADAFGILESALVCYAVKANSSPDVLKILAQLGSGADVVSVGELKLALSAGIPADRIVFSGVAKTADEIRFALEAGIFQLNIESEPELMEISRVAETQGKTARVALRVNPDIAVDTNEKIATGNAETKFGISWHSVKKLVALCENLPGIDLQGIAVHLGSQIKDLSPYGRAFDKLASLIEELRQGGASINTLDIGGGLGIDYEGDNQPLPTPADLVSLVQEKLAPLGCKIIVEPGRSLVGNAGILLSKVIYEKTGDDRNFLIIDAGMNDLLRPSMYNAFHRIVPACAHDEADSTEYDIVGPVCETGDIFGKQRRLPKMQSGDLVAILDAGAYGAVMASTYNARPLVAEVLVSGKDFYQLDREVPRRSL